MSKLVISVLLLLLTFNLHAQSADQILELSELLKVNISSLKAISDDCQNTLLARKCYNNHISEIVESSESIVTTFQDIAADVSALSIKNEALAKKNLAQNELILQLQKQIASIPAQGFFCALYFSPTQQTFTAEGPTKEVAHFRALDACMKGLSRFQCEYIVASMQCKKI